LILKVLTERQARVVQCVVVERRAFPGKTNEVVTANLPLQLHISPSILYAGI
jgi:hypothetical protein